MHILILNTVALNGGDGAILVALMQGLVARLGPSASFVVHEAQPEAASRYYPDVTFRPTAVSSLGQFPRSRAGELRRSATARVMRAAAHGGLGGRMARWLLPDSARVVLDDYLAADVVITTGGTYLVEHYDLDGRILSFDLALAARKPLVLYTQSLGPFLDPSVRASLRRVLSAARLVFLRDALSRDHLVDIGLRSDHLHVVPDSVFSLADPDHLAAAGVARRPSGRRLRVAISVREWRHFTTRTAAEGMERYRAAVRAATVHLVKRHGADVTFLSTCQGIPEYAHDDAQAATTVVGGLPPEVRDAVSVDGRFLGPQAMLDELASFDLVLSTRMHFAIMALVAGIPVIPIAYEFKMRELFGQLGHGQWVHDIESVEPEALVASIDELLATEDDVRRSLLAAVAEAHGRAEAGNDRLAALLRDIGGMAGEPPVGLRTHDEEVLAGAPVRSDAANAPNRDRVGG